MTWTATIQSTQASLRTRRRSWIGSSRAAPKKASWTETSEFNIFGPAPDESDTDHALLVGKCSHGHHRFASAATGIGLVRSVRRGRLVQPPGWFFGGEYERLDRTTVGLPLDVKASLNASAVGIGLNLFGNLNTRGSFAGVALTLQLGRFP